MRLNNNLIINISVTIISFFSSLTLTLINPIHNYITNYWINALLAVFGSSIVMALTSIGEYFSEKKR